MNRFNLSKDVKKIKNLLKISYPRRGLYIELMKNIALNLNDELNLLNFSLNFHIENMKNIEKFEDAYNAFLFKFKYIDNIDTSIKNKIDISFRIDKNNLICQNYIKEQAKKIIKLVYDCNFQIVEYFLNIIKYCVSNQVDYKEFKNRILFKYFDLNNEYLTYRIYKECLIPFYFVYCNSYKIKKYLYNAYFNS